MIIRFHDIWQFIQTHPILLIEIFLCTTILCLFIFFLRDRKPILAAHQSPVPKKTPFVITSHDIKAIAGDSVMATQLDLARGFIEIGKATLAKKILRHVLEKGNPEYQAIAKKLMLYVEV